MSNTDGIKTISLEDVKAIMAQMEHKPPHPIMIKVSHFGWEKLGRLIISMDNNRGFLTGIPIQIVPDSERDFWINEAQIYYSDGSEDVLEL